jgi:hypothetical protein
MESSDVGREHKADGDGRPRRSGPCNVCMPGRILAGFGVFKLGLALRAWTSISQSETSLTRLYFCQRTTQAVGCEDDVMPRISSLDVTIYSRIHGNRNSAEWGLAWKPVLVLEIKAQMLSRQTRDTSREGQRSMLTVTVQGSSTLSSCSIVHGAYPYHSNKISNLNEIPGPFSAAFSSPRHSGGS